MVDIRNFDGERKSLVYDNYNKLIAATETIRTVPTRVNVLLTVDEKPLGST
jgi:vacuolar protein sorting-associated protein 51